MSKDNFPPTSEEVHNTPDPGGVTFPVILTGREEPLQAHAGETLLSCFRRHNINIESTCNGKGVCGKCAVRAGGALSPPDESENRQLSGRPADFRLACRSRVQGPVTATLEQGESKMQTVFTLENPAGRVDSPVSRIALPEVDRSNGRPYLEGLPFHSSDPEVLSRIAGWERTGKPAWGIVLENELIDVVLEETPLLGAAVDVGTTGLSLFLYDLESGERLGRSSALNPQTAYGGDVITRITYCREQLDGLQTLQKVLLEGLAAMLDQALGSDYRREQVYLATVAANTTMLHLLAGINPYSIALSPFRPAFLHDLVLTGAASGLPVNPRGRVILLPGASAYIGADIIAGLEAVDYRNQDGPTLFIDIGTNGEMVLIDGPDKLTGASCAVGPALEGMNIGCGCRAVSGAIDSFTLEDDLTPRWTTIDNESPVGICGSGLIELTAALVSAGLIPAGGAFKPPGGPATPDQNEGQGLLFDRRRLSQPKRHQTGPVGQGGGAVRH